MNDKLLKKDPFFFRVGLDFLEPRGHMVRVEMKNNMHHKMMMAYWERVWTQENEGGQAKVAAHEGGHG